jgi:hypothetical protein
LKQQTIKILVGTPIPTYKGSAKVASAFERLVNLILSRKFITVVVVQRFHPV